MVKKLILIILGTCFICLLHVSSKAQICKDTSAKFFLYKDSVSFYTNQSYLTKDNNLLICGQYAKTFDGGPKYYGAFLTKTNPHGNVLWSKYYDSLNPAKAQYLFYTHILELADNSILIFGKATNALTGNDDILITKTDPNGTVLWNKLYKSAVWTNGSGSADLFNISQVKQDPSNGEIYLTAAHWNNGRNITKLDPANGNILWSKYYDPPIDESFDRPFGIAIKANEIISFGRFGFKVGIYRINKTTGDTIQTKFFGLTGLFDKLGFLTTEPVTILANGNYVISGMLYGYYNFTPTTYYQAGVMEIDTNLNFVNAYCFRNIIQASNFNSRTNVFPDGSGVFSMISVSSAYTANVHYVQFKNGQIVKQRIKKYLGEGIPFMTEYVRLPDGSDLQVQLIGDSAINTRNRIEFLKLTLNDTSSDCIGKDASVTYTEPYIMVETKTRLSGIQANDLRATTDKSFTSVDYTLSKQSTCEQVSYCDSFRIRSEKDSICISAVLNIKTFKNANCGAQSNFTYDTTALMLLSRTDTVSQFRFKKAWSGYIRGDLYSNGCNNRKDSIKITGLSSPRPLDLGKDTSICPNNTIVLNARSGFYRYTWQDGSTDSVFNAKQPGKYFVSVFDACGNFFSDTLLITLGTPPLFTLPIRAVTKCNNDSVPVVAPTGFISYKWFPENSINNITGQSVMVYPTITTTYVVTAEKTRGCFVADSVVITVKQSPIIHLGVDTTVCTGNVLQLNAGNGFATYNWSTGNNSSAVTIDKTGTYSVKATSANGCISADTIKVTYEERPVFSLGRDTTLCEKQVLALSPGVTGTYQWQDLSKGSTYSVKAAGLYWLQVNRGSCIFRDSITVVYYPLPILTIPADTIICNKNKYVLNVTQSIGNTTYLWDNGSTDPVRSISSPGNYKITVTSNACISTASLSVKYQQMPYILFRNDTLKCASDVLLLDAGTQDARYLWQDMSTQSTFLATTTGNYSLTVSNFCGAIAENIHVGEKACICEPAIPNVFSPNGDGINDEFHPVINCTVTSYTLTIFDRDGRQVFQSSKPDRYWNGAFQNKPVPIGAYYYLLKVKGADDTELKTRSGIITLIR